MKEINRDRLTFIAMGWISIFMITCPFGIVYAVSSLQYTGEEYNIIELISTFIIMGAIASSLFSIIFIGLAFGDKEFTLKNPEGII